MRQVAFLSLLLLPFAAEAAPAPPLDVLFNQLKHAGSPEEAKPLEDRIGGYFLQTGSATVELLMTRGAAALAAGDNDTAKKLYESVTSIAPDYAEGWHNRANLQHATGDDTGAMLSLEHAILLNPRQFVAMSELASMLEDYGNKAGALKLYRKALEIDPQLDGAKRHVDALTRDVEGQGI